MKKLFAGLFAGLVLGTAGVAGATSAGYIYSQHGVVCKAAGASAGYGVACIKDTGDGYGVGFTRDFVIVTNSSNRIVFKRYQLG